MKRPHTITSTLFSSVQHQLNMCAIVAVVGIVSLLALAQRSEAKIVYTATNVVINPGNLYKLDLNHDGVADLTFQNSSSGSECSARGYLVALLASGNGVVLYNDIHGGWAAALGGGAPIGQGQQFHYREGNMALFGHQPPCFSFADGPWINVTNHYLGLSFQIGGRTHYGWARLSVQLYQSRGGSHLIATLTGYAFETIPGKAIKAGQKKEAADDPTSEDFDPAASVTSPIPDKAQQTSLGMLALGAQDVPVWRWEHNEEIERIVGTSA